MVVAVVSGFKKISLPEKKILFIDSDWFDKTNPTWWHDYCDVALNLEYQGFTVLVDYTKQINDYLNNYSLDYTVVVCDKSIKDDFLHKLSSDYESAMQKNDYENLTNTRRLYFRARDDFDSQYSEIMNDYNQINDDENTSILNIFTNKSVNYSMVDILKKIAEGLNA